MPWPSQTPITESGSPGEGRNRKRAFVTNARGGIGTPSASLRREAQRRRRAMSEATGCHRGGPTQIGSPRRAARRWPQPASGSCRIASARFLAKSSDSLPSVTVTGRTSTTGKGDAVTKVDLHVRPLADIAAELRGFEARFGVASDRLLDAFRVDGKLRETDDFFAWSSLYAAWQAQRSLDTIVELPKLTDRRQRVRNLFLQRGVDRFDTENDVEACVTALEDERLRAMFEVALKQFLTSLDIVMPRPESLPFNRDAKFFGMVQVRARRRYREGDAFDVSRYGEKVRALIDDHVLAVGVDQKIPPVSITAPDFRSKVS